MASTRDPLRPPPGGLTLHCIGDVHIGSITPYRYITMVNDVHRMEYYAPIVCQLGDSTESGLASEDAVFKEVMDRTVRHGAPWYSAMGNHDIWLENKTPQQWADTYGHTTQNYIVDTADVRLIFWNPPVNFATYTYVSAAQLSWLDGALGGTSDPCMILIHFPLHETVGALDGSDFPSTEVPFYLRTTGHDNSSEILDVLAAHPNMKAWIYGHTHSRPEVPGFVMPVVAGSVRFAAIQTGAPRNEGRVIEDITDKINSYFVTFLGDEVQVRVRNHGAGTWAHVNGRQVMRVGGL